MKTTDLIPILLYQLKEGDKYGLELVEACKKCTDNKIEIKQPTPYSILKKLEKSRFISSYWKDSDIGGKRHYFKITENGLSQLETYPPLEELVKLALLDDVKEELNVSTVGEDIEIEKPKSTNSFEFTFDSIGETKADVNNTQQDALDDSGVQESDVIFEKNIDLNETIEDDNSLSFDISSIKTGEIELPNSVLTINERKIEEQPTNNFDIFDAISYSEDENDFSSNEEAFTSPAPSLPNNSINEVSTDNFETISNNLNTDKLETSLEENISNDLFSQDSKLEITSQLKDELIKNEKAFEEKLINLNDKPIEDKKVNQSANKLQTELNNPSPAENKEEVKIYHTETDISYTNYEDFATSPKILLAKKYVKLNLVRNVVSSMLGLILILSTLFISIKTNFTTTYVVFTLILMLYIVFKLCRYIGNYHKLILKYYNRDKKIKLKKILISKLIVFAIIIVVLLIINLFVLKDKLFETNNLGNFVLPLIEALYIIIDYIVMLVCFKAKKIVKI